MGAPGAVIGEIKVQRAGPEYAARFFRVQENDRKYKVGETVISRHLAPAKNRTRESAEAPCSNFRGFDLNTPGRQDIVAGKIS
jgi:hypothetical protein